MNKFIFELCQRYQKNPLAYRDYNTFIHAILHDLSVELEADEITKKSFKNNTMFLLSDAEIKELKAYQELLLNECEKFYYVYSKKEKEDDWTSIFINYGNQDDVPDEVSHYYINFHNKEYHFISGTKLRDEIIEKVINGEIK